MADKTTIPTVADVLPKLRRLYALAPGGGMAHGVTDDGNFHDRHIDNYLADIAAEPFSDPAIVEASRAVLLDMRRMTVEQRQALLDAFWP